MESIGAVPTLRSFFGEIVPAFFWLKSVNCSGNESSLYDCQVEKVVNDTCHFSERAGVVCVGTYSLHACIILFNQACIYRLRRDVMTRMRLSRNTAYKPLNTWTLWLLDSLLCFLSGILSIKYPSVARTARQSQV